MKLIRLQQFLVAIMALSMCSSVSAMESKQTEISESEIRGLLFIWSDEGLLPSLGPEHSATCITEYLNREWVEINKYIRQGNSAMASAAASNAAKYAATCSKHLINDLRKHRRYFNDMIEPDTTYWAEIVGRSLSVVAQIEDHVTTRDHAIKMLEFAKQRGRNVDPLIAALKAENSSKSLAGAPPALRASAISAISQLVSNEFAFNQNYLDKVIEVTGKITRIRGGKGRAEIVILGNTKKSKDDLTYKDSVNCVVINESNLSQVLKLRVGENATVRGVYKKGFLGQIELDDCQFN